MLDLRQTAVTFEGIGGLSAGASSRLLIDYPEAQRGEILDFLFKPNYGASIQHLKVEIGGDVNSTDGTEPSIARTRDEFLHPKPEYFNRGYEWWLMKEAKKRNSNLILDVLQWGAPAWIGNGNFYSQDNADFIVAFIKGAKKYHDLDIGYCGIWNETPYNVEWIKLLRRTLNTAGLERVKIVAADEVNNWSIADKMAKDPELRDAIQVIGSHYPGNRPTPTALSFGKPVWASEDGSSPGGWNARGPEGWCRPIAQCYNQNYAGGKITATIIWSPIASYYDIFPFPGSGLMKAIEPWSGHYEVQPAIWMTAHTTQFIQPGWKYLAGNACAMLPGGGSRIAAVSPDGKDLSIVIETLDAQSAQPMSFKLDGGINCPSLHIWRSTAKDQFIELEDLPVENGGFNLRAEPGAIYSVTTTSGQRKGETRIPPPHPLPLPYKEDFESRPVGATPKYLSDFYGAFEIARKEGGGRCLRQVITKRGISWLAGDEDPLTFVGSTAWRDYEVACDVCFDFQQSVSLHGRITKMDHHRKQPPTGYSLRLSHDGAWQLCASERPLASGQVVLTTGRWYRLALQMAEHKIIASIDGKEVGSVIDKTFGKGCVAMGCGYEPVKFANLSVTPVTVVSDLIKPTRAVSSSDWSSEYTGGQAVDGDPTTRWNAANGKAAGEWLELDFRVPQTFNRTELLQFQQRITRYKIQYWDGSQWCDAYAGGPMALSQTDTFPPVTASKIRLLIEAGQNPSIYEFEAFKPAKDPAP